MALLLDVNMDLLKDIAKQDFQGAIEQNIGKKGTLSGIFKHYIMTVKANLLYSTLSY